LTETDNVSDRLLIADTYYNYFKALSKSLAGRIRIANKLKEYSDFIISNKIYELYKKILVWVFIIWPDYENKSLGKFNLGKFIKDFQKELHNVPEDIPSYIRASIRETELLLESILSKDDSEIINKMTKHLHEVKDIPLYPLSTYIKMIAIMAPRFYGNKEYENLYDEAEQLITNKETIFSKAQLRKDRAMQLYKAGYIDASIRDLNIIKFQWYSEETLRGSLLSSWMLHQAYRQLKLFHAAIYELLFILQLSTTDLSNIQKDLIVRSLAFLYYSYLEAGYGGTAYIFARLAIGAERKYRIETHPEPSFYDMVQINLALILNDIREKYPTLHENLISLFQKHAGKPVQTYLDIVYSTEEEFEKGFKDPKELGKAKKFRKELLEGKFSLKSIPDNPIIIDETESSQKIEFCYQGIHFNIAFSNAYYLRMVSESISSFIQILIVEINEKCDLCWIEDEIQINISRDKLARNFQIRERPNNRFLEIDVRLNDKMLENFYKLDFDKLYDFEIFLFSTLITLSTIDKSEDIKQMIKELNDNGFFEKVARRTPYGFLYNKWFGKECFNEIVKEANHG